MESPTLTPQTFATAPTVMAPSDCPSCGAPLAVDQRYCLQCGERRGEPRVPLMRGGIERQQTGVAAHQPVGAAAARAPRAAASTTLVAGVGTLLMALGVGVLIGHSAGGGTDQAATAPPVQVVTVAGAAGGTAADQAAGDGGAGTTDKSAGNKHASRVAKSKHAASDIVAPATGKKLPKKIGKVVKPGDKGRGAGYKNGKFTGDFFGQ